MSKSYRPPEWIWRGMRKMNHRMVKNYQRGFGPTRLVLLLTTTGRKSGLPRTTPLQYEEVEGAYYVASGRGEKADWYRNIQVNRQVEVQIQKRRFCSLAEPITDPGQIADFLALRLNRHPLMIGLLMRMEGLPLRYSRRDLEAFAAQKTLVLIRPEPADAPHRESDDRPARRGQHTETFGQGGHDYNTWASNLPASLLWAAEVW